ncbi:MAG: AAA family ATPase [Thermodesulfobacteriota bacterium]|nr:AAA family ATPase [Thermodesulfobacteriota bacterium]
MKFAITGKGGVGKTTCAVFLARAFIKKGYSVLAIDADPDANLAEAFGYKDVQSITPISDMKELIQDRTGASGGYGAMFKLNPQVDDLPDRFCIHIDGVKLMVVGAIKQGGGGCACPENVLLKNLVQHIFLKRNEIIIMDMEAGIEHLGRATAHFVDKLIVVVEPGRRSIETAQRIKGLALDIGLETIGVVGNKVRSEKDRQFMMENLSDFEILGFFPYRDFLIEGDIKGGVPSDLPVEIEEELEAIISKLLEIA